MKKRLVALGAAASIGLTGVAGLGMAHAANQSDGRTDLIDKISQKFNLNRDDVQKVFDEERAAHEAEHKAEIQARLDAAVASGTLTQAQADGLKAKQQEMQEFRESLKDKTPEERHAAMKTKIDELKQWMTDNNIPAEYQMMGRGGHGGPGRGMGQDSPDAPAAQ